MKIVLVFISMLVLILPSLCAAKIEYKPIDSGEKISYPKIDKIEQIIFGQTNENLDITHRLNIIEKKLFNKVYDKKSFSERIENITAKLPQENLFDIDTTELAQIENRILGKMYKNDTFQKRLERLEKKVFGAVQSGEIEQRYNTIKTTSAYYTNTAEPLFSEPTYKTPTYSYSEPQYTQTYSTPKKSQTFWGNIKDSFSDWGTNYGYMTGYTPPITPYYSDNSFKFYPPRINPYYNYNSFFPNRGYFKPNSYYPNYRKRY